LVVHERPAFAGLRDLAFDHNLVSAVFKTRGPVAIGTVGDTVAPGISFTGNTYLMDDLARAVWAYGTYPLGRLQWQGKGQDQAGVFKTW